MEVPNFCGHYLFWYGEIDVVYVIYYRCTVVIPLACLAVSILAYPRSWPYRFAGVAVGLPLLMLLDFARLVDLSYMGVYHPTGFEIAHGIIWCGVLIMAAFGLWWGCKRWEPRRP